MSFKSAGALNHRNWNLLLGDTGPAGQVLAMLHGNSLPIVDSSRNAYPVGSSGAPTVSNAIFVYGGGSIDLSANAGTRLYLFNPLPPSPLTELIQVEGWFRPTILGNTTLWIFSVWDYSQGPGYLASPFGLVYINGFLTFSYLNASGSIPSPFAIGQFTYFKMTYDGEYVNLYINNALAGSSLVSLADRAQGLPANIRWDIGGFNTATYTLCCQGYIDDFRIIYGGLRNDGLPPPMQLSNT